MSREATGPAGDVAGPETRVARPCHAVHGYVGVAGVLGVVHYGAIRVVTAQSLAALALNVLQGARVGQLALAVVRAAGKERLHLLLLSSSALASSVSYFFFFSDFYFLLVHVTCMIIPFSEKETLRRRLAVPISMHQEYLFRAPLLREVLNT